MSRLNNMRKKMLKEQLEGFVVARPENSRYISGFTGGEAILFILMEQAYLLTDFRYIEQATAEAPEFQIIKVSHVSHDLFSSLADLGQSIRRIGFEGDYITLENYRKMEKALPQAEFISLPELVSQLRSVKDESEIAIIRRAVEAADKAFAEVLQEPLIGQSEEEIALVLEFAMRKAGASGRSFDFIVASGWRGSLPHGMASSKRTQKGEFLTMDFGAIVQGYCSDITRTVSLGEPDAKQREIYEVVLAAQKAGIDAVKPGLTGKEIDAAARKIITEAGYGEFFGHGLGHSVGLAIHEGPNFNTREERVIEPGMVITVEPGIYIPDWGGVRIEDMILVTENGCEVLTQAPKDLIIIE